jgi:hypothetical protein
LQRSIEYRLWVLIHGEQIDGAGNRSVGLTAVQDIAFASILGTLLSFGVYLHPYFTVNPRPFDQIVML